MSNPEAHLIELEDALERLDRFVTQVRRLYSEDGHDCVERDMAIAEALHDMDEETQH